MKIKLELFGATRDLNNKDFIAISTIGYNSSVSINRILSHFIYSFRAFMYLMRSNMDIIYVVIPPNWLALIILIKQVKKVKIIVDVLDLWPEAFPHNNNF